MQNFNINGLRVAKPCPVSWESMSGDDRMRFCRSCELNVYNISEMTPAEVQALVENSSGRVCAKMYRRADGTVITRDCPVGLRKYRGQAAKYYSAALGAILGLFTITFGTFSAFGQTEPERKEDEATTKNETLKVSKVEGASVIKGTVTDPNGAVVAGAEVAAQIKGKSYIFSMAARTNEDGVYVFPYLEPGSLDISVSSPGFKTYQKKDLPINLNEEVELNIILSVEFFTGVIVTSDISVEVSVVAPATVVNKRKIDKLPF
jgi:hypothetical protein